MTDSALHGNQFWNANEIVGDQVEEKVGSDAGDAAMLGLAHGAVLLAPTEDALDHRVSRWTRNVRQPRGLIKVEPGESPTVMCLSRRQDEV